MAVKLKVVTTTEFADLEAVEEWLKNSSPFKPSQALELLENKTLTITEDRDVEETGTSTPTTSVFTLEDSDE